MFNYPLADNILAYFLYTKNLLHFYDAKTIFRKR
jgi:hypothetical protein